MVSKTNDTKITDVYRSYSLKHVTFNKLITDSTELRENSLYPYLCVQCWIGGWKGAGQTGSDVIEPLEFLLFDVVVTDALSADDTLADGG